MPKGLEKTPTERPMKKHLYAIYDTAAAYYMDPWTSQTDASAMREFENLVNKGDNQISHNPQDFTLFSLGEWTNHSAVIIPTAPVKVLTGLEAQNFKEIKDNVVNIQEEA